MTTQTVEQMLPYEQTILEILHTLPSDRIAQVIEFARFMQWQVAPEQNLVSEPSQQETLEETEEEIRADNERWDQTFANSRATLNQLVREAREDIKAGRTQAMVFTKDGRITPG